MLAPDSSEQPGLPQGEGTKRGSGAQKDFPKNHPSRCQRAGQVELARKLAGLAPDKLGTIDRVMRAMRELFVIP